MEGYEIERKGNYRQYQAGPVIHMLNGVRRWSYLRWLGRRLKKTVMVAPAAPELLKRDGFVMLVRKNANPEKKGVFEGMRNEYSPADGQLIYSMWDGCLEPEHLDKALADYIRDRQPVHLHTSGHAYVETITRLIETVQPKKSSPCARKR